MASETSAVVVVGVDGSDLSSKAVQWADRYAQATDANVRLVITWQWATAYGAPMMFDGYDPRSDAETVAEKAKADITLPAGRVEVVIREGQAGPVLAAVSEDAAALVVGSHGHSAVSKVLLGSVSAYCVHHASCPVVVVR